LLIIEASLASAEVSAGALAKADQYAQYYISAINCNFTTLYTNVVPGEDDVLHLRHFGL
jgi:hypothetical protein